MRLRWLLLFLPCLAAATVNEPFRLTWQTGYRNDRLHWHLQDPGSGILTFSEKIRNLQFWENALSLRVIHRDLTLFVRGAYGAFGRGDLKNSLSFRSEVDAWSAGGWGYFGYAVTLTPDRVYKVILVPLVGYGVEAEKIHSNLRTCWYGLLFGGYFLVQPGNRLQFEAGYAYHRVHVRLTAKPVKVSDHGNLAHSGWASMEYIVNRAWRIGLAAQIQYFASRLLEVNHGLQKFKARWTPISGYVTLSRSL
jgi:hypothetical protein